MSFLDDPSCLVCFTCPSGTDDPAVTREITRGLLTAFLERELRGETWPEPWLTGDELGALESAGLVETELVNGF